MSLSSVDRLDMRSVVTRAATWRFDLLDSSLRLLTSTDVHRNPVPTVAVNTASGIKRTLRGIELPHSLTQHADTLTDRLRLTMLLDDGSEWPQGVFLFADESRLVLSSDIPDEIHQHEVNLTDQLLIVDQQLGESVSFSPGTPVTDAIGALLVPLPVVVEIESSASVVSVEQEAVAWPATTSRLQVINELARQIGYHDLYFDNTGVGRLGPMPNPDAESDFISYPSGGRTFRASVTKSTDLLELPNRFVVVNNGATQTAVFGVYDIPSDAPHSASNRGFVIPHVEQMQGIQTMEEAILAARNLARSWQFPYETVEFAGPPDPRHDTYDVIEFEGDRYLELGWSMPLQEGANMRHTIRRTYEPPGF